jgi:hypothetical protein
MSKEFKYNIDGKYFISKEYHIDDIIDDSSEVFANNNNFGEWHDVFAKGLCYKNRMKLPLAIKLMCRNKAATAKYMARRVFKIFLELVMRDITENHYEVVLPGRKKPILAVKEVDWEIKKNVKKYIANGGRVIKAIIKEEKGYPKVLYPQVVLSKRWQDVVDNHIKMGRYYGKSKCRNIVQ